jgi:regulator of sirC expression with transglutaminase-like and TPR domain
MGSTGGPEDPRLVEEFSQLSDDQNDGELNAACLVSRALSTDVDITAIQQQVEQLIAACTTPETPWLYLRTLGFQGGGGGSVFAGSRLDTVIARRSGLPISLGVLLIHLARAQGLESWGVNFPGRFLVKVGETLVDPYEMAAVSEADCLARLAPDARQNAFARAPTRLVALRMLNNLKYQYAATATWERALDMLDFQLALVPGDAPLLFERGDFWLRLGAVDAARTALKEALEAAVDQPELAALAREQLNAIGDQRNTIH